MCERRQPTGYFLLLSAGRTPDGKKDYLRNADTRRRYILTANEAQKMMLEQIGSGNLEAQLHPVHDLTPDSEKVRIDADVLAANVSDPDHVNAANGLARALGGAFPASR